MREDAANDNVVRRVQLEQQQFTWLQGTEGVATARLPKVHLVRRPAERVWSAVPLRLDALDIDHALPWSAWPCCDFWNLVPSSRRVNEFEKRDWLPSATVLVRAREPILAWWHTAGDTDPTLP